MYDFNPLAGTQRTHAEQEVQQTYISVSLSLYIYIELIFKTLRTLSSFVTLRFNIPCQRRFVESLHGLPIVKGPKVLNTFDNEIKQIKSEHVCVFPVRGQTGTCTHIKNTHAQEA